MGSTACATCAHTVTAGSHASFSIRCAHRGTNINRGHDDDPVAAVGASLPARCVDAGAVLVLVPWSVSRVAGAAACTVTVMVPVPVACCWLAHTTVVTSSCRCLIAGARSPSLALCMGWFKSRGGKGNKTKHNIKSIIVVARKRSDRESNTAMEKWTHA